MSLATVRLQAEEAASAASARLPLWGDLALSDPWFLALAPLVSFAVWWGRRRSARARGHVSTVGPEGVPRSLRQRLAWLPGVLALGGMLLAVLALARPVRANVESADVSEGVDIVAVLDRSSSMIHEDMALGRSRLAVVKDVVAEFVTRRTTDREGAADKVALLSFARFPELLCPFTLDTQALLAFLEDVELARSRHEDGTAIGVALAKAVAVLDSSEAESRVVVLLTDGENNFDDIAPLEAAELAAEKGVRVYTIFSAKFLYELDPFRGWRATEREPDTRELRAIAELTGGRFYRARDEADLQQIYAEIEALERTPREERRFEETFDLYPRLLLPGLLLYALARLSDATWARRLF